MLDSIAPHRLHVERDLAGSVAFVRCLPDPRLAPHVHGYYGYEEQTGHPMRRREVPRPHVVLIVDLGPTLRFLDPVSEAVTAMHDGGFIAGLHGTYVLTETSGRQSGLQVNFTPLGARHFFGQALASLVDRVVRLDDVLGPEAALWVERIAATASWPSRFAIIEALLVERMVSAAPPPGRLVHGYRRLVASRGRVAMQSLAAELDCSRQHLVTLFRDELGLGPKLIGRMLRFNHATSLLEAGGDPDLAAVALAAGYYDQSHMNRDFRAFAGAPPGDFLRRRLANEGGLQG
jgi:AraC-like DNA-binding protein